MGTQDLEAVRDRLARTPGELTPHRVAEALRETGRPVGDAEVLAVYETLRRDVVGAGRGRSKKLAEQEAAREALVSVEP